MLGVRISEDLESRIEKFIKKKKITKSQFVKSALNEYLREEELRLWHDEKTLKGIKDCDEGRVVSKKSVLKMMASWQEDE